VNDAPIGIRLGSTNRFITPRLTMASDNP